MDQARALERLQEIVRRINDINSAAAVLYWDQATYMPPGGAEARGRQLATLGELAHSRFVDDEVGGLLETLHGFEDGRGPDDNDAALVRLVRRRYGRLKRIPASFSAEVARHGARAYDAWTRARPADDFGAVRSHLERGLQLSRRLSGFFPEADHVADPLIGEADEGLGVGQVRPLFETLRPALVELLQRVAAAPQIDDACLHGDYPAAAQVEFAKGIAADFGFDFARGRCDLTHHPFATKFAVGDVRLTTRADDGHLEDGLFATLHEAGHGMYEQGADPALDGTPLSYGASSSVHESQSRLWENVVGRSLGLWSHYYPRLQEAFPEPLRGVSLEAFYAAVNKVQPSLIRVQADEVTYGLHIMVRFELELALLEGELEVADLPGAWRQRYGEYLGVEPADDRDGVLQDVHWYAGLVGGSFHSYLLGNVMNAQIYAAARAELPDLEGDIAAGRFGPLHGWLCHSLYRHGSKYTADELMQRVCGGPLRTEPYLAYLQGKFGAIYGF